MMVCEMRPRFDQNTGKPLKPALTPKAHICDFCGKLFDPQEEDLTDQIGYTVIESGDIEPYFHEMRVEGFPNIDIYSVFNEHPQFRYCIDFVNGTSCERDMLFAYMKGKKKTDTHISIASMIYDARVVMLAKILAAKTYTLEQLKLDER